MTISRRALLGFAMGGLFSHAATPASAARFIDGSGLRKGQFVWQPGLASEGSVLVVVTGRQQVAHVYRGGREIGIAVLKSVAGAGRRAAGAFVLADQAQEHRTSEGRDPRLHWTANAVHLDAAATRIDPRQPLVLLPDEFAPLLFKATQAGATVVLAEERGSIARVVTRGFPLLRGAVADQAATDLLARAARPLETADPMGREASIVVSLADRAAHLVRGGVVERSAAIEIANGAPITGCTVFSLAAPAADGAIEWLAIPIARGANARHVADDAAAEVLSRITIADERLAGALAHELGRGALLSVTDTAVAKSLRRWSRGFELMSNRERPAPLPEVVAEAAPRPTARPAPRLSRAGARVTRTVEVPETGAASDSRLVREMFDGTR